MRKDETVAEAKTLVKKGAIAAAAATTTTIVLPAPTAKATAAVAAAAVVTAAETATVIRSDEAAGDFSAAMAREKVAKQASGRKIRGAPLPLGAVATQGRVPGIAEVCAVRTLGGSAVVEVVITVASQTTTMGRTQEKASIRLPRTQSGGGEGIRAGGGRASGRNGDEAVTVMAANRAGEGRTAAVRRPWEEQGLRGVGWWRLRCHAAGFW